MELVIIIKLILKCMNFKNINEANTKLASLNKINKALKEIRLIKPTNIKKKINN